MSGPKKRPWARIALIVVGAIAFVGAVGIGLTFTAVTQPSGSMLPTLEVGQRVVINKLRTDADYGDVIVFRFPDNREHWFVKRVIARPGDTLEVLSGRPIVNGELVPACLIGKLELQHAGGWVMMEYFKGRAYLVLYDAQPTEDACTSDADCAGGRVCRAKLCGLLQGPYKAKSGEVWVMGDNRNNSHDSRSWNGGLGAGVPLDDVVGSAMSEGTPELPDAAPPLRAAAAACLDKLRN